MSSQPSPGDLNNEDSTTVRGEKSTTAIKVAENHHQNDEKR